MRDLLFVGIVAIRLAFGSSAAYVPGDIFPDSHDCAKYLQSDASGNNLDSVACPTNQLFNPNIMSCDTSSQCNFQIVCPPTGIAYLPNINDCTGYIICNGGIPRYNYCPAGLSWDIHTTSCIPTSIAKCEQLIICPPAGVYLFGNPNNIHTYFECNNGYATLEYCVPASLVWDDLVKACVEA